MFKTKKLLILYNLIPRPIFGLIGGIVCVAMPGDAKIPTALAMTLITSYAARWGTTAGYFIGLPIASRASGLTTAEIKEIYTNPALMRQITRNSKQFVADMKKLPLSEGAEYRRTHATPSLKANGHMGMIMSLSAVALATAALIGLKPIVSEYFAAKSDITRAGQLSQPLRNLPVQLASNAPQSPTI